MCKVSDIIDETETSSHNDGAKARLNVNMEWGYLLARRIHVEGGLTHADTLRRDCSPKRLRKEERARAPLLLHIHFRASANINITKIVEWFLVRWV